MAVAANKNYGFRGEVSSAQTPLVLGRGVRYSMEGPAALKVAVGSGDRAITVAAGTAWGDGVLSVWDSSASLKGDAVSTGAPDRWDTVVIRRSWTPAETPTGTATLMLLAGGAAKAVSAARTTDAGVTTSDQPVALVRYRAGQTAVQEIVDLRVWAGVGGGLVGADAAALGYLSELGTTVIIKDEQWFCQLTDGVQSWRRSSLVPVATQELNLPRGAGSGSGWYRDSASWCTIYSYGPVRYVSLQYRRTFGANGGVLTIGGSGQFSPGSPLLDHLPAAHRPPTTVEGDFHYRDGGAAMGGSARLGGAGDVRLISGVPNTKISPRDPSGDDEWSVRISFSFIRPDA